MGTGDRLKELRESKERSRVGSKGSDADYGLLARIGPNEQELLLQVAQKVAKHGKLRLP
jgi:hypothetical protein